MSKGACESAAAHTCPFWKRLNKARACFRAIHHFRARGHTRTCQIDAIHGAQTADRQWRPSVLQPFFLNHGDQVKSKSEPSQRHDPISRFWSPCVLELQQVTDEIYGDKIGRPFKSLVCHQRVRMAFM